MDTSFTPPARSRSRGKSRSRARAQIANRRDYVIGIFLLLCVVVLWTTSNFVTQDLFQGGYEKPFLVTYLNTSAFALYLLPFVIRRAFDKNRQSRTAAYAPLPTHVDAAETLEVSDTQYLDPGVGAGEDKFSQPLTIRETAQLAAVFCLLWFIANWTVNASLDYTSVASATILSSMSGFFTLAIGRVFKVESLTLVKIGAVFTSFIGVVLVSLSDSSQPQPSGPSTGLLDLPTMPIIGDALALLSALFYALYVTLLKVRIRSESRIDMQLFFGFVGLFNILTCWPIGVVLHLTGVEPFQLPSTSKAVVALLVNMVITLSSDYIYVIAMLKTTPLVVTVGLSLTMPLAVLGDWLLSRPAKAKVIFGAVIVISSFVALGFEDSRNAEGHDLISGDRIDQEAGSGGVRLEEEVSLSE
ncbi:hypothetical protein BD309DRAFT_954822 [Dichomitus squalens]|uniref:DUF3955 domain-containing protein n=1 Tax=Dichomitus squalens TaxID=114155 RepID=A0A4Q9Q4Z3_9APHY|nr:hypothetical protein BD309DRAFT_954822 [Dichomitus squalens]TBU61976.1 hypothetical protein BD310DRAFT_919359 [Dichomitus squalens]